jgi:hypothetical protein
VIGENIIENTGKCVIIKVKKGMMLYETQIYHNKHRNN